MADYVASTALVDLADHESFFWTESVSGLELLVVSVCAGVGLQSFGAPCK